MPEVVLVDELDNAIGHADKLAAHAAPGQLHRAFSVVLVDWSGRMLLQQRAASKYHFRSLWANSCCGHPAPGEDLFTAARRRVHEELGVTPVELDEIGTFRYQANDPGSGLVEHEIDHVLLGRFVGELSPDPDEVQSVAWMTVEEIRSALGSEPDLYVPWLAGVLDTVKWATADPRS